MFNKKIHNSILEIDRYVYEKFGNIDVNTHISNANYKNLKIDVENLQTQMNLLLDHLNVHVEKVPAKTLLVENE